MDAAGNDAGASGPSPEIPKTPVDLLEPGPPAGEVSLPEAAARSSQDLASGLDSTHVPTMLGAARRQFVDETVRPMLVERDHPIPQRLTVHAADLRRLFSRAPYWRKPATDFRNKIHTKQTCRLLQLTSAHEGKTAISPAYRQFGL